MSIGTVRALRILHRAFGRYPIRSRVHILIRFLTCPFLRTIDDVPSGVRVLDIGAGHGLLSVLLTEERVPHVLAVDPDLRKVFLPSPSTAIRKVAGYDEAIRGQFGAVVMFDVSYLLGPPLQRSLFERVFQRLEPGGTFVLKEMDPSRPLKIRWARFQERLNESYIHTTEGSGFTILTKDEVVTVLRETGFVDVRYRAIDRGYLHPHLLYTARKP
jgi:SAM-dependent methyltransferase